MWSKGNFEDHEIPIDVVAGSGTVDDPFRNFILKRNQPADNYQSVAVNARIGFKYFFNENAALRFEALDTYAFKEADFGKDAGPYCNITVTGGLFSSSEITINQVGNK